MIIFSFLLSHTRYDGPPSAENAASESRRHPFLFTHVPGEDDRDGFLRYKADLDREFSDRLVSFDRLAQENIVFIYDEARALLEKSKFIFLRRALTHFPRSKDICTPITLVTDTTAKISNFSPSQDRDSSTRVTKLLQRIFRPFYLFANVDIWVKTLGGPKTLKEIEDPNFFCRYGRPYWGAASQFGNGSVGIVNLLELARAKVLGGIHYLDTKNLEQLLMERGSALAVLGIRACIDMVPQCQLSQDLVAQHMRTLYSISEGRDAVVTGYFSEPILALVAGQLTNALPDGWNKLMAILMQSLRNGQVNAGFRGELVARLLLLMAWDRCVLKGQTPSCAIFCRRFLDAMPLMQFLSSLLILSNEVKVDLSGTFQHAWVRCTHFVKIDYAPDSEELLELFKRGAVAVAKEYQTGTDIIIPVVICSDRHAQITPGMVSCIMVQVKNRVGGDPGYPGTATSLQTPLATGIRIGKGLPYVSLYMGLGEKRAYLDTPVLPQRDLRSGVKDDNLQKCLAVFSISSLVYAGLDEAKIRLLNRLNQYWIDPIALQQSDKEKELAASMLPCQVRRAQARNRGERSGGGGGGGDGSARAPATRAAVTPAPASRAAVKRGGEGTRGRHRKKPRTDDLD